MNQPQLPYQPPQARFLVGFPINAVPMTRNETGRTRERVVTWLETLETSAAAIAETVVWDSSDRYAVVIEVRIPWAADIDNYIKDMLDRSARQGVFGGQDERVDLVHAIKRSGVNEAEAGAHMDIWLLAS
jgi:hypothetical protein